MGRAPVAKGFRGLKGLGGGVRAPRLAGDEVVLKSLGGGEFVVGEDDDPR